MWHGCDYKLVVSDLDGTLLDSRQQVSERTRKLLDEFRSKGSLFTIATGRNETSVKPFVKKLKIDIPCILYNGAKVASDKEVLFERKLPAEQANEAIEHLRKFDCDVLLYVGSEIYIEKYSDEVSRHLSKDGTTAVKVDDLSSVLDTDPYKVLMIGSDGRAWEYVRKFRLQYDCPPNVVQSEDTYLEILPAGVSKGTALERLAFFLDIPLSKVIAFGDNINDLDMLTASGLGIAVRNANPVLLREAGYVTGSNEEEGVADILEMLLKT